MFPMQLHPAEIVIQLSNNLNFDFFGQRFILSNRKIFESEIIFNHPNLKSAFNLSRQTRNPISARGGVQKTPMENLT